MTMFMTKPHADATSVPLLRGAVAGITSAVSIAVAVTTRPVTVVPEAPLREETFNEDAMEL